MFFATTDSYAQGRMPIRWVALPGKSNRIGCSHAIADERQCHDGGVDGFTTALPSRYVRTEQLAAHVGKVHDATGIPVSAHPDGRRANTLRAAHDTVQTGWVQAAVRNVRLGGWPIADMKRLLDDHLPSLDQEDR